MDAPFDGLLFMPVSGSRCLFSPSIEVANRQLITVANVCFQLNFGLFGSCKLKWRLSVVNKTHPDPLIQTFIYPFAFGNETNVNNDVTKIRLYILDSVSCATDETKL